MPSSNRRPLKRKVAEGKIKGVENDTTSKRARMSTSIKPICGEKSKQSDANLTNQKPNKTVSKLSKPKSSLKKTKRLSRKKVKSNHVSFSEAIECQTASAAEVNQKALTDESTSCAKNKSKKPAKIVNTKMKTKAINKLASSKMPPVTPPVDNNKRKAKKRATKSADELQVTTSSMAVSPISIPRNTDAPKGTVVQNVPVDDNSKRFTFENYDKPCTELAKYLLGKLLVYQANNGCRVSGRIVETEAYLGGEDKASHSYNGKKTDRILAMYMPPGTSYVYNIYGVYACVNVSSKGDGAAVLIRSLEPVEGVETMKAARRSAKNKEENVDKLKEHQLCNGPSKLTQALGITKANGDQVDLITCKYLWIEDGENVDDSKVVACSRIGIGNYAQDWTDKPLRFYVKNNKCVSVRDKKAESC